MKVDAGGVMRMREIAGGLEIAPGATVELKPGGYHVMFMDLTRQLQQGESVKGTLVFEKAGKVEVEFKAEALAARGASGGHSGHGGMKH
jgi:copper(I)-binding protein